MDFDRITLIEARLLSKVIDTLGDAISAEDLAARVNICEICATLYRKQLTIVVEQNKAHA